MRFESLRLDEILKREEAIAWNEGVSVLQAICRELPDLTNVGAPFPLAAEVAIAPDGTVSLLRRPSGSPGVTAAGHLLGDMLQSDVPVKLRLIHSEAVATTPAFHSLKDLSDALAYFERPDAQHLIQELYARAAAKPARQDEPLNLVDLEDFLPETSAAAGQPRTDSQLSLVKPDSGQPAHHHSAPAGPGQPLPAADESPYQRGRRRQAGWVAAAAVLGFVIVASGAFLTYGLEQPAASLEVENADPSAAGSSGTARTSESKDPKAASARTAAAKDKQSVKAESRPGPDRTRGSDPVQHLSEPRPPAASDAIATTITSDISTPDPSWAAALPLIVREPLDRRVPVPSVTDANGEFVYSRANPEVVPPVAIRPHLPSEPPADYSADHMMVLDLVVTSRGEVESVRLLTLPKTINDFMIVSAAKAWLFAPAKLNGRPVKYKHRIRFVVP